MPLGATTTFFLICGNLKVVALLLSLQKRYTKYPRFLCLWDSRAHSKHFTQKVWPSSKTFLCGIYNMKAIPLVDPKKILLPLLRIKLGPMKNMVKVLTKLALLSSIWNQSFHR